MTDTDLRSQPPPTDVVVTLDEPAEVSSTLPETLMISGEQTIRNANELLGQLKEFMDQGRAAVVDLSGVSACDTAALQLICALRQYAVERNRTFRISAVSPAIGEAAAAIGLHLQDLSNTFGSAGDHQPSVTCSRSNRCGL